MHYSGEEFAVILPHANKDQALYAAKSQGRNMVLTAQTERRRHPRVAFRGNVRYRYADGQISFHRWPGHGHHISQSGLGLHTPQSVEARRPLEIVIQAPGQAAGGQRAGRCCANQHYILPGKRPAYHPWARPWRTARPEPAGYQALLGDKPRTLQ